MAIRVYSGPGAGDAPLSWALDGLRSECVSSVSELGASELLAGGWEAETSLLVVPGGRDVPLLEALGAEGAARVRCFVEGGGSYLGLCAGAYFACEAVDFEASTRVAVTGPRPLRFCPGVARGSVVPGFAYGSEAGAAALRVRFCSTSASLDEEAVCYANGAPAFVLPTNARDVQVLALYSECGPGAGAPAALRCQVLAGVAVLCGPHPEMNSALLACGSDARELVLASSLAAAEASRRRFWRALLTAAGVALLPDAPTGAPPSPLRTIGAGPVAASIDGGAAATALPSPIGPLRSCSVAGLLDLPPGMPDADAAPLAPRHPEWPLFAPPQRFGGWLLATALMAAASRRVGPGGSSTLLGAIAGTCGLAAGAQVRLGHPRAGVPMTAQTLSACLLGLVLGPLDGAAACMLYATAAAAGAPVLSPHGSSSADGGRAGRGAGHVATAGYVAGFALCAVAVGHARDAATRRRASSLRFGLDAAAAAAGAQLLTALLGGAWAAMLLTSEGVFRGAAGTTAVLQAAVVPFIPGLALKAALTGVAAAAAAPLLRGRAPLAPALRTLLE